MAAAVAAAAVPAVSTTTAGVTGAGAAKSAIPWGKIAKHALSRRSGAGPEPEPEMRWAEWQMVDPQTGEQPAPSFRRVLDVREAAQVAHGVSPTPTPTPEDDEEVDAEAEAEAAAAAQSVTTDVIRQIRLNQARLKEEKRVAEEERRGYLVEPLNGDWPEEDF